jgi:hypothetical protein
VVDRYIQSRKKGIITESTVEMIILFQSLLKVIITAFKDPGPVVHSSIDIIVFTKMRERRVYCECGGPAERFCNSHAVGAYRNNAADQ